MRYLIKNKKELAISIGLFVMTLLNLIRAIMSKDITEECIVAFVLAALTLLGWFYNMPTSKENCEMTGEMRLKKRQNKGKIDGEDFIEEPQEVDE